MAVDYISMDGGIRASPIDVIEAGAEGINAEVILCGHTHLPRVLRLREGRMTVNPGSVGLPGYDGQAPVSYVVGHLAIVRIGRSRTKLTPDRSCVEGARKAGSLCSPR